MRTLITATLRHYRGIHALVIAGVAVAVSVLAGALLVGASVRGSLRDLALARLGATDAVVTSTSYFRAALADEVRSPEIAAVAPVLAVQAAITHSDTRRVAAKVNVFGVDDRFLTLNQRAAGAPQGRDAWISPALASELGAAVGDEVVLRLARPTDIPLGHLQGRRDDASQRVRVTVRRVATREELGEFSLLPAQGAALTALVPLSRLQQDLDLAGSANALLVRMAPPLRDVAADVRTALSQAVQLEDLGLRLREGSTPDTVVLESRTGLLTEDVWQSAAQRARDRGGRPAGVLTYLANVIRANGREIPYSLVAAIDLPQAAVAQAATAAPDPRLPPIQLNAWAAADLGLRPGDRVDLDYYLWSDQDGLQTRSASFAFAGVVPMDGPGGDATLTPAYPGITDAADVTSWDPPFPVDLQRVRKVDEEYWDRWRAAPKAFIPLAVGQRLWASPYGNLSSLRTTPIPDWPPLDNLDAVLTVRDVRREALAAANGTTDFGEYFIYFSFFLVVSALLLAGTFFALSVEQRARELGLLLAVGFRRRDIRRVLMSEALLLSAIGAAIGLLGAVAYGALLMYGLRTWWVGAVNTTALELHVDPLLLLAGAAGAMLSAVAALAIVLRRTGRVSPRALLLGGISSGSAVEKRRLGRPLALALAALAIGLVGAGVSGLVPPVAAFFSAGGLLMLAGCAGFAAWLHRPSSRATGLLSFGAGYARWRPLRSVLSAALIAFACFVIVAVSAFRRDGAGASLERSSGTGGYVLLAESIAPLMHNPNTPGGREELSLSGHDELEGMHVSRFRLRPGDEASCLTLYEPRNPRIVAPEAAFIGEGRFTFARSLAETDAERANPWLLLDRRFEDGAVPAIADITSLTYVFHLAVGDDFVFTPDGGSPVTLRIVGALADSVLQSELIIGEQSFTRVFPTLEGYRLWLIDAPEARAAAVAGVLEDRLADFGVDATDTRARLASYHQVENTYLSTFQALGALGLLLGTLGLAAVLARNVVERRRELGLLGAVGFTERQMRTLVTGESLLLVGTGVAIGTLAAFIAIAPAIVERASSLPYLSLALLVLAVVVTGWLASMAAVRMATSASVVAALRTE